MPETASSFIELSAKTSQDTTDTRLVHCENWRKSGLSMSEYCRRSGVAISSLSTWLKKCNSDSTKKPKVKSEKTIAPVRRQGMEIVLVSGIRLRFIEIGNIGEIIRLIKALESCS